VIQGATNVEVMLANGDVYDDVAVVDVDERRDLVLLKIKAFGLTPAALGDSGATQVGASVVLVGSPQGLNLTVSEGVISSLRDSGSGYQLLQTSAPASPGSSGGGMFNEYGELIGIVTSQIPEGQNLNFAVPINYVRGLLATEATMTLAELADRVSGGDASALSGVEAESTTDLLDPTSVARLSAIIDASDATFERSDNTTWVTSYEGGDYLEQIDVYVRLYTDGLVLVQALTVDADTELTDAHLIDLLKLNYNLDLAKVSLSEDGTVSAMTETELRLLDGSGLELITLSVALAADEAVGILNAAAVPTEDAADLIRTGVPEGERLTFLSAHLELYYDSSDWTGMAPETTEGALTQEFAHSSGEVFLAVFVERSEIPGDSIYEIALTNARDADPNVRAIRRGTRDVNGVQVRFQEMQATVGGIPATFLGHYYSDSSGTIQILGWTATNLIDEHLDTIERFAAGLVVVDR
jgi:hypothetical protein